MSKEILYGRGTTENIVAVEPMPSQKNIVRVFKRVNGTVEEEVHPYMPFVFVDRNDPNLNDFSEYRSRNLFGTNPLNLLVEDENWSLLRAISSKCRSYLPFLQSQWMLRTGETLFKGMNFDDPLRLYVDIEVYTSPEYDFPNASRAEDKVIIISLLDNRGRKRVMALNDDGLTPQMKNVTLYDTEQELLEAFCRGIRQLDPDILILHNGFGFDLPYLRDRMQYHGITFGIGRDGSEPYTFHTSIKFAEKNDQYENFQVYGRHVIDTYFLAKQFDVVARTLPSYSLKECAKFLGVASEDRVYIEGNEIASVWDGTHPKFNRQDLIHYALDDVYETRELDLAWGQSHFIQAHMIPLPLQDIMRYGTGNKIDLLFTRYYLEHMWSWPVPDPERKFQGGYANTFYHGLVNEPLVYCDVGSLYPTLRKLLGIQPKKDELRLFQKLMDLILEERNRLKKLRNEGETEEIKKRAKAADSSIKLLSNTGSYGWLSWAFGAFNDYDEAERITTWGQKVVKRMNYEAEQLGSRIIRTDTDGSLMTVPQEFRGDEGELKFIKQIETNLNKWLETQL